MKYIIYLNILLLIKFTSGVEEPLISSTISPVDQTDTSALEDPPGEIIDPVVEDIHSSTSVSEDGTKNETISDIINTNSSSHEERGVDHADELKENIFASVSPVTESEHEISETDPLPKLPEEEIEEMEDMQFGGNFENIPKTIDEDDEVILPYPIENDVLAPTSIVEWIQEDEEEPENDVDTHPFVQAMTDTSGNKIQEYFMQGQIGIILASLLIVILVCVYLVFIAWRRITQRRYGNRQILINEEDMIDPNDMKHFSL